MSSSLGWGIIISVHSKGPAESSACVLDQLPFPFLEAFGDPYLGIPSSVNLAPKSSKEMWTSSSESS